MPRIPRFADTQLPIETGSNVFVPGPWYGHCELVASIDNMGRPLSAYRASVFPGGVMDPAMCFSSYLTAREASRKGCPNV